MRFVLRLGITKADQLGTNPPIVITDKLAVRALARWLRVPVEGDVARHLFCPSGRKPVVFAASKKRRQNVFEALGFGRPAMSGKAAPARWSRAAGPPRRPCRRST